MTGARHRAIQEEPYGTGDKCPNRHAPNSHVRSLDLHPAWDTIIKVNINMQMTSVQMKIKH